MADGILYFPKGFKWGTASAAHQVEGNNTNSQWWAWEQLPGKIANGDKSGLACDWWNNAEADFDRMVDMGLNAHRLSIEWSRIEPRDGVFDEAAIERYRAILLGLRRRGIEPMVTLHHFSNPIWLEDRGGWIEEQVVVPRFARFVRKVVRSMGDLCDLWCTLNEPNIYALMGYLAYGRMPPGRSGEIDSTVAVVRNMLLAHGAAYQALHEEQALARVGIAHHMRLFQPLRPANPFDNVMSRVFGSVFNQGILDAVTKGRWNWLLRRGATTSARALRGTLDWIGLNYYSRERVSFAPRSPETLYGKIQFTPGAELSDFGYGEIHPDGMTPLIRKLAHFGLPIYITENGIPDADDDQRPGFLLQHLQTLWRVTQFNWRISGYYHWSFVDNFEWGEGFRMKFGLYAMDPATQERTLRRSGMLMREIARTGPGGAISSAMVREYAPQLMATMFPGG
ncbi:MAG TPA: glycoside hydrolase family 1 protein [Thermoflexales bacterium]|nr:glycoside hydrolase family 1 protein [Thermoflexales bacterium]HQX11762.1 glycoside hydrolase family 1 protein [Thermoflexales bacterium]HQY25046.1 glycoside hydrolase family 1 protein [Thermoflexales bacterium]HQZ53191.1 glycoside hydrolase family 1 protein [Thermoflexales bacterium]